MDLAEKQWIEYIKFHIGSYYESFEVTHLQAPIIAREQGIGLYLAC